MDQEEQMRERLSALADGELPAHECGEVFAYAQTEHGHASWQAYHVIGDVLRGVVVAPMLDVTMLDQLRARIARERVPADIEGVEMVGGMSEQVASPEVRSANASLWHWKMAAGFASLTAAVALGWTAYANLGAPADGGRLASAGSGDGAVLPAVVALPAPQSVNAPIMVRDPRLDELLAAHKRYGSTIALQMPANFLRNASFEAPPKR